ncbi:putative Kynurenine/alpha-aminoadipate aminotransferase mitochondrial precursor [Danaus plexippus plexippus]|uniref:Kynurenine/alpha-aminoadipate aminotransferase mitochondrial n=1 Tax=Danaus plexippus plexippus TaxID=278856 RepID=A0A212FHC4_DANPL|nr:putative Kynurenine/alpha-aminoadipate aminotransferase mitochondrial precursor [Danaus plexippus plexippus]
MEMSQRDSEDSESFFKYYSDDNSYFNKYKKLEKEDFEYFLSRRGLTQKITPTQQLSELAEKYDRKVNKNLSEGMNNELTFPFTDIEITKNNGTKIIIRGEELEHSQQYLSPKGLPRLHSELMNILEEVHRPPPLERDLLVTNGTHHGLQLCTDVLVDPGDPVVGTEYSYIGLHAILRQYEVEYLGIPEDKHGLIPEILVSVLNERLTKGLKMPKVMYLIPTVSNPTGYLMTEERKQKIYEIACKYNMMIVEDDVYMYLNYTDMTVPSFLSMDTAGRVLRVSSLSKVMMAGLRVGWVTGPTELITTMQLASYSQIVHPCSLAQTIVLHLVTDREYIKDQIVKNRDFYKKQLNAVHDALTTIEDLIEWEKPDGGYYIWVKIRGIEDVRNMVYQTSFIHGLMLEPGHGFSYDHDKPCPYIRLTFTKANLDTLEDDVKTIGDIIRHEIRLSEGKNLER